MNRPRILLPSILGIATLTSCGTVEPVRPNIIYIMSDDHAQSAISIYDGRYNDTPGLDRIAKEGVLFSDSFVANSISGPSRACLLTGKHSHKNGYRDNENQEFDGSQQTFPKLLQAAGYTTGVIGKWHLVSTPTGFDHWDILPGQGSYINPDFYDISTVDNRQLVRHEGYVTDIVTDKGIEWISQQSDSGKPFCLLLHHKAVHRSWVSDSKHIDMYEDVVFPVPSTFFDDYSGRPAAAAQEMTIAGHMDLAYDLKMVHDDLDTPLKKWDGELARMDSGRRAIWDATYSPLTADFMANRPTGKSESVWKFQRYMRDYLKCVASLDDNVGRLMDYLESEGLLENTIVVYASDQGFYLGEHGWYDKRFMYEESMRTPLLVRLPDSFEGVPRGEVIGGLVQNIDYAPTLLSLAGVEIPADIQGESFAGLLRGEEPESWREDGLYYHYYEYPGVHAVRRHFGVRTERYKLMHFYGHDIDTWELYDLERDPMELVNLYDNAESSEYAVVQADMHKKLERLEARYDAPARG